MNIEPEDAREVTTFSYNVLHLHGSMVLLMLLIGYLIPLSWKAQRL